MKLIITLLSLVFLTELSAQNCNEPNSLLSVRKRKTGRTEYVIFTLKNEVTASMEMSDTKPPFHTSGEGSEINIKGCKYKKVSFHPIVWTCKVKELLSSSTYLVRQVKSIDQFEGYITYVIGYRCNAKSVISYSYDDGDTKKFVVRLKY